MTTYFDVLQQTEAIRGQILDSLSDADLAFSLPNNPTVRELFEEMGAVEAFYSESFKTLRQDWATFRPTAPQPMTSLTALRAWFAELDSELHTLLMGFSESDLDKIVERGFSLPVRHQVNVYREALLIFYGKLSVYLKAMGKPFSAQMQHWIG
jgi:hypothetical protein